MRASHLAGFDEVRAALNGRQLTSFLVANHGGVHLLMVNRAFEFPARGPEPPIEPGGKVEQTDHPNPAKREPQQRQPVCFSGHWRALSRYFRTLFSSKNAAMERRRERPPGYAVVNRGDEIFARPSRLGAEGARPSPRLIR